MTTRDYIFVVDEELSDGAARAFEGMHVHRDSGTTTIEGPCRDQAELLGTLVRISDLGLTLLSFAAKDLAACTPVNARPTTPSPPMAQSNDASPPPHNAIVSSLKTSHRLEAWPIAGPTPRVLTEGDDGQAGDYDRQW